MGNETFTSIRQYVLPLLLASSDYPLFNSLYFSFSYFEFRYGSYPTYGYNVCADLLYLYYFRIISEFLQFSQLFSVDEMLSEATDGELTSVTNISTDGAIILVTSTWNCNLDRSEDSMY